jgi:hypothetical protein
LISEERQKHIEKAVDYYLQNEINVGNCAKLFGIHRTTLGQYILKRNPDYNSRRRYSIDEHFFDSIDTEEKAYILGYLTADGCIKSKPGEIKIGLSVKDIDILEQMRRAMKNEKPLKIVTKPSYAFGSEDKAAVMIISCAKMYRSLESCGFSPQKSKHEVFCDKVPKHLYHHYIRGIFDGDGWFSYTLKNGTKEVGFGMGQSILDSIRNVFCEIGVSEKYTVSPYKKIFRYRITSTEDVKKIFDYLYKDATIFLKRKHDKMLDFCRLKASSQKS